MNPECSIPGMAADGEDDKKDGDQYDHPGEDFFVSGPQLDDGGALGMHHTADHELRPAILRPLKEGMPLPDEAVILKRRDESNVYDRVGTVSELRRGPSKANSRAFCEGYDRIFGKKPETGEA